jgi:peroxiredoxin
MKKLILLILIIASLLGCGQQEDSSRGYKVKVGDPSPKLNFTLMDGTSITNQNLKGKVVVLQFTASWCSVCREEMPHLESKVWQRFKNEDFLLIGIDLKEKPEKVKRFIEQMQVTYPFAIDADGALFESFTSPPAGVTRNIVLDKNGEIIFLSRLFEEKEFNEMIKTIDAALKKS